MSSSVGGVSCKTCARKASVQSAVARSQSPALKQAKISTAVAATAAVVVGSAGFPCGGTKVVALLEAGVARSAAGVPEAPRNRVKSAIGRGATQQRAGSGVTGNVTGVGVASCAKTPVDQLAPTTMRSTSKTSE